MIRGAEDNRKPKCLGDDHSAGKPIPARGRELGDVRRKWVRFVRRRLVVWWVAGMGLGVVRERDVYFVAGFTASYSSPKIRLDLCHSFGACGRGRFI